MKKTVLKAKLDDSRVEETYHIPLLDICRITGIPIKDIRTMAVDTDNINVSDTDEDAEDDGTEMLILKIVRQSPADKRKKARWKKRYNRRMKG